MFQRYWIRKRFVDNGIRASGLYIMFCLASDTFLSYELVTIRIASIDRTNVARVTSDDVGY
jgi:hypothetical protein